MSDFEYPEDLRYTPEHEWVRVDGDIARIELELTLTTLFRRLPELRLAVPYDEIRFRAGGLVYGVQELPVTW